MTSHLKSTAFRILISFAAIGLIVFFMRGEIGEAWKILRSDVNWSYFLVGLVAFLIANAVIACRFLFVLKTQHLHLSYWESLYLSFLGLFFNLFFPSAIGGDVAKAYYTYKHTGKKIESFSAVLQDRLIGFAVIMGLALLGVVFVSREMDDPRVIYIVLIATAVMIFAMLFFASKRFARKFKFLHFLIPSEKLKARFSELYHGMSQFKHHPGIFVTTLGISFVAQTTFISVYFLLSESLNAQVSFGYFFLLVPVIAIVSMVPSLGGLGVREAGLIFFVKHHMGPEKALVLSILVDMLVYGISIGSGIIYALHGGLKSKAIHEMEELEAR